MATLSYNVVISFRLYNEEINMDLRLFSLLWISEILCFIFFFVAIQDKYSIWKQNVFFWLLLTRQVLAFFEPSYSQVLTNEMFIYIKVLLLYVMVTAYHSLFGVDYELLRIFVLLMVYFWVGVSICMRFKQESEDIIDVIKKSYGYLIAFTIFCFNENFVTTLVIRYFQEELVKFLNSKQESQRMFESILQYLEESIISIDE